MFLSEEISEGIEQLPAGATPTDPAHHTARLSIRTLGHRHKDIKGPGPRTSTAQDSMRVARSPTPLRCAVRSVGCQLAPMPGGSNDLLSNQQRFAEYHLMIRSRGLDVTCV